MATTYTVHRVDNPARAVGKKYIITRPDQTLDQIVYNRYGSSFNYLEKVLAANPSLNSTDIFLPKGLTIYLPDLPKSNPQQRISLWN